MDRFETQKLLTVSRYHRAQRKAAADAARLRGFFGGVVVSLAITVLLIWSGVI